MVKKYPFQYRHYDTNNICCFKNDMECHLQSSKFILLALGRAKRKRIFKSKKKILKIKHFNINLTKYVQDLYENNYKTQMNKVRE